MNKNPDNITISSPIRLRADANYFADDLIVPGESLAKIFNKSKTHTITSVILLVQGNDSIKNIFISNSTTNYQIIETEFASEGIIKAQTVNPDLIIGNLTMNKIDGFEFCQRLKANPNTSHIPVMLIADDLSDKAQLLGLRLGVESFITQPVKKEVIQARIHNIITSRKKIKAKYMRDIINSCDDINVYTDENLINKLIYLIYKNIADSNFDVNHLSKGIGLSRMHLYRKTKAILNVSPNELIKRIRIMRAAQLLESSELRINEVMDATGFDSRSAFVSNFKKITTLTPTEYSKEHRVSYKKKFTELVNDNLSIGNTEI